MPTIAFIDAQRGALFPWSAVLYAAGIGTYLGLPSEPSLSVWGGLAPVSIALVVIAIGCGETWRPFVLAFLLPMLGFSTAAVRTYEVAAPTLGFRYYGPVEGRVVGIDRSQSDAVRLTLDRVVLLDVPPDRTPARVRVSLHGDYDLPRPDPGSTIGLTGHLSAPGGPVEPGGYDFRRHAWFLKLGAVGYTRNPVVSLAPAEVGLSGAILRLRFRIADGVRSILPGEAGGFAAAITTGDRSQLDRQTVEALRATNLAHLLAISGLHLGLLTGVVFGAIRFGLAAVSAISLQRPVKKIAAFGALVAGAFYLALSGNNVATERAFIMVGVMFAAVLFDRKAITLRAVAIAAMIVLTFRPETLVGPGFQMSFAATTALVAVYGWLRKHDWSQSKWPWGVRVIGGVALSSGVAGLATAPMAAAHFNQIPHYGLLANILSVPLMGLIIIPGAVAAAVLWPVGLAWAGLFIMRPAIDWILAVAREIASWHGALSFVPTPSASVLPLIALGGISLACLKGRSCLVGIPVLCVGFGMWVSSQRPQILISETGGQVGVLGVEGRVLSRARGDGFASRNWLENDGDPVGQVAAGARVGWKPYGLVRAFKVGNTIIYHGTGKQASEAAIGLCEEGIVVVNAEVDARPDCLLFDPVRLAKTGALAINIEGDHVNVTQARRADAQRPWSQ